VFAVGLFLALVVSGAGAGDLTVTLIGLVSLVAILGYGAACFTGFKVTLDDHFLRYRLVFTTGCWTRWDIAACGLEEVTSSGAIGPLLTKTVQPYLDLHNGERIHLRLGCYTPNPELPPTVWYRRMTEMVTAIQYWVAGLPPPPPPVPDPEPQEEPEGPEPEGVRLARQRHQAAVRRHAQDPRT
jgi:hypothetical protein